MSSMLAYGVAYALAVAVGHLVVPPDTGLALFWPAAGVGALWALVATGRRQLVIASAAIWALSAAGLALSGIPGNTALVLGVANVVGSVGAGLAYRRLTHRSPAGQVPRGGAGVAPLRRHGDVGRLVLATTAATVASAVVGMAALALGSVPSTVETLLVWLLRNGAAIVVVAGTGLAVLGSGDLVRRRHLVEFLPVLLVSLTVLLLVFGPGGNLSLSFLALAVLVWGGLRLPVPLAALQGATTSVVTLALAVATDRPVGEVGEVVAQVLTLEAFMLLAPLLSLVLSTVQWERDALVADVAEAGLRSRRQAEDLRVITESVPQALLVTDRDGTVLLQNGAARRWLAASTGVPGAPDATARPSHRRGDGLGLDRLQRPAERALGGETVRGMVLEADDLTTGQPRLVAVDAVPLHDGITAQPDRALLLFRDVTDDRRRVDDVQAAHARTERLIADAPNGVAVLDVCGRILRVNASLAGLTGRAVDALVGRSFDDLLPDHRADIGAHLRQAVAVPGSRVVGEWTIPGSGGEDRHVTITSRLVSAQEAEDDLILVNIVDLSERRRHEQRLAHLADHDMLTGLPNRRRFEAALAEHLDLCARSGPRGALLLLDLDHFKEVNDTCGHDAGDQLLVSTAAVLRGSLRKGDLVARLGGDEFAILLPDADRRGVERVAELVVERLRANRRRLQGANRRVTASIGAVTFAAANERAEDVLALADLLMYDAKDAGRDRFRVLDNSVVQPRSGTRIERRAAHEAARENDDLRLYLQPLLHLDTGGSPVPRR